MDILLFRSKYCIACSGSLHAFFNPLPSTLADLGALGNYPGSPFLPSDSEILLDSPEQEDIGNGNYISCF
jgi:hypothetical protein